MVRIWSFPAGAPAQVRPRFRGVIHAAAAPAALIAGIALAVGARTISAAVSAAVFTAAAVTLFTVSAVYHLGAWAPQARVVLRRLDHADILLLIAATYTPFAVLALHGGIRSAILCVVWVGALLGAGFRVFWITAPRRVYVALYLCLGWVAVFVLPQLLRGAGPAALILVIAGGVVYSLGGVAYGLRQPNPWPRWFGYHEVFHTCTVIAFTCQYIAVSILVRHVG